MSYPEGAVSNWYKRRKNLRYHKSKLAKAVVGFKIGKCCENEECGTTKNLTVHNHNRPREEWQVYCRNCHDKIHGIVRTIAPAVQSWYELY